MAWEPPAAMLAICLLVAPVTGCLGTDGRFDIDDEDQAPAQRVDIEETHAFSDSTEAVTRTVEIPPASGPYDVALRIEPSEDQEACAAAQASVELLDPNGTVYEEASTTLTVTPSSGSCGATTQQGGATLTPGNWTVRFEGNGTATGILRITN